MTPGVSARRLQIPGPPQTAAGRRHVIRTLDDALGEVEFVAASGLFGGVLLPGRDVDRDAGCADRPAELVGGDVYDIYERRPGEFRVFIADARCCGAESFVTSATALPINAADARMPSRPAALAAQPVGSWDTIASPIAVSAPPPTTTMLKSCAMSCASSG